MRTIPSTIGHSGVTWGDLRGIRVYLAGPRTCLDPVGYAALTAALCELGLVAEPVAGAFERAARDLRRAGAEVLSAHEQAWWRGAEVGADDLRAGRAALAAAPASADLVAVLDGWLDVPGAVDGAVITARTAGVPVVPVVEALATLRASATLHRRPAA